MEQITAKELLKCDLRGKIVCFPTDTVYGVGALYDDIAAIKKIYQMKHRSVTKPLAILTPTKDISQYVLKVSKVAQDLMDQYWPGPLTLIFQKSKNVSDEVTMGYSTIAIRMPNSPTALTILNKFGLMATTSVNVSGEKELNSIAEIASKFSDYLDYLVIDQEEFTSKPSKIIDVSGDEIKIIRN